MSANDPAAGGTTINIGTRKSALALRQAEYVLAALRAAHPTLDFAIQARDTAGDTDKVTPLAALGKGLWTSEFEARLVAGELDLVVHSAKDMPTNLPAGCALGAVTAREDPRDTVVFKRHAGEARPRHGRLADLPAGSVVGTSSVRRMAQLRRRFPGLSFTDIRGNIDTRLRKLDDPEGPYDCIILAAAGLNRMGFEERISEALSSETPGGAILHAVGQGALGIEVREGDERIISLLQPLIDRPAMLAVLAERAVMRRLEGGCSVPIGVETKWLDDGRLRLQATVVSLDGKRGVDADISEQIDTKELAETFGVSVAEDLVKKGAQEILDEINSARAPVTGTIAASAS